MALKEKLLVVCSCPCDCALCKKLEKTFALVCLGQDDPSKPPRTIPGAPWLEVGPGWWLESEASRRGRCARNHVKTMVRGRKDYHVYKSRQGESFFYPQRLWMAFGLSMWIQLLVTLFFVNLVQWMAAVLGAAQSLTGR